MLGVCSYNKCVFATEPMGLSVLFCLNSCCNHMTKEKKAVRFVRLALIGGMQNDGGRVYAIVLSQPIIILQGIQTLPNCHRITDTSTRNQISYRKMRFE